MKEMQFRIDVLEEFFQLNTLSLKALDGVPPHLYDLKLKYTSYHHILDKLAQTIPDVVFLNKMSDVFHEAITKRFIYCATCEEEIDIGTRNFPKRNTLADRTCENCGKIVCTKFTCQHFDFLVDEVTKEKSGSAYRIGCVQCMGPVSVYTGSSSESD